MGEEEIALFALAETTKKYAGVKKKTKAESAKNREVSFEEDTQEIDEEAKDNDTTMKYNNKQRDGEQRKLSLKTLKSRLSMVRLPRPDFSRILTAPGRPNFSRMRRGLGNINCFRVEEEESPFLENMDMERHKSVDLGLRRTSLYFFKRKASICQHPYHPYTPKQTTRMVWNVHHHKT